MDDDAETNRVIEALACVIRSDQRFADFASVARHTFPDETCSADLKRRYATLMRPHLEELHGVAAQLTRDLDRLLNAASATVQ